MALTFDLTEKNILVSVTTFLIPQLGSADQLTKSVDEQPTNFDTLVTYLIDESEYS